MTSIAIGVHVHAEPDRLRETLAAIEAHTPPGFDLLLLPDAPDSAVRAALGDLPHIRQSALGAPLGAAACFNRLARETDAETLILIESGALVAPGWLQRLLAALNADPRHGVACPSTNRAWNELAAFPEAQADSASLAYTAAEAERRFGAGWKSLAPLYGVGDFCLAIKRAVLNAIGPADEGYGLGPCWEMDLAAHAARAGFGVVWAQSAFVFRHPFTPRRQFEESRLFEASRRRYQDRLCGLRRDGRKQTYADHCHGGACPHFAPPEVPAPTIEAEPACSAPLVTCLMPTRNRADWVPQAIRYFEAQDYPNLELVIVDASADGALAPLPNDPRIRRIRASQGATIGAMRNLGCEQARGEIVLHWDDDDFYAPSRVSAQVRPILDGEADVTGLHDAWFFELDQWLFWRCAPALHAKLFIGDVHGGTLAFRRALHGPDCRYPEVSLAEDAYFLQLMMWRGARLKRLPGANLFVYLRHGANAWNFPCGAYLDPQGWRSESEPALLAADRAFYVARSRAAPPTRIEVARETGPLVSCLMPTANRRRFAPHAIASFLAQDYANAELVILDDGEDSIADLAPDDPRVRYLRAPRHRALGEKRNAVCEAARGDILLHWDDDDWYAPHRVRLQVDALLANRARVCGLDRVLFLDAAAAAAWEYAYPPGGAPWAYGATLAYRRDYWREHPFPNLTVGEDNAFTAAAAAGELLALNDNRIFVGLVHPANTSVKNVHDARWRAFDVDILRALTGSDWPSGGAADPVLPSLGWGAGAFAAPARAPCEAQR